MPIFDYECKSCGVIWESIEIRSFDAPKSCPECASTDIHKVFTNSFQIRPDSNSILKSMPDPSPPLEELRGKTRRGCVGGYEDKPHADTNLKNYTRRKDKYGNTIWIEKRRSYFDGTKNRRSSAERED